MCYLKSLDHHRRRGVIVPLVGIAMIALMAVTGLVIDGGLLMAERRHAQSVADSAALAAAVDLFEGKGATGAKTSALAYAKSQGYANDGTTSTVTVNIPPAGGPNLGDSNYVEVLVSYRLATFFIQAVSGQTSTLATARAVAGVAQGQAYAGSLLALSPHGAGALTVTGTGTIDISGGSVHVNSDDPKALLMKGTVSAKAKSWDVVGGYGSDPYVPIPGGGGGNGTGTFSPKPNTGVAATTDPFATMTAPDSTGLSTYPAVTVTSGTTTLNPGVYKGGITVSGGSVTLNPGVYIIDGGGIAVTGSAAFSAPGVTIVNTGTSATYGPLTLTSSSVSFSPPTSGKYQGLMVYQDAANTKPINLADPQSGGLTGTFYAPGGSIAFNANGGQPHDLQLIAGQLIMNTDTKSGNADIQFSYNASRFARPGQLFLVE